MTPTIDVRETRAGQLESAVSRASRAILTLQRNEGYWSGDLTADTTLESDYLLLQLWLHPPVNGRWDPPSRQWIDRAMKSILIRQLPNGGFPTYPKGPADVSATVKAYFALKLAGIPVEDPRLIRARDRILELGGIQAANSYVKINLSLFGLYPREDTPAVPPEIVLLGSLMYQVSSWSRTIIVPLSIVLTSNSRRPVPDGFDLAELFLPGVPTGYSRSEKTFTWRNFFLSLDGLLKWWEKRGLKSLRRKAIRRAAEWMIERLEASAGLGAIYPPMMYSVMAFDVLGYAPDHPLRKEALRQFEGLMMADREPFFFVPCFSPVWDTALGGYALGEGELAESGALARAADWLLSKEIRRRGDWAVKRPRVEPSGWAFEFNNSFYPDIGDTAMVLLSFRHLRAPDSGRQSEAERRALRWLIAMQSSDGGWAAFDADNNWYFLSQVPFADHNAMLDPTCADITGRCLEALAIHGVDRAHPSVRKGVEYLRKTQEPDGSWYGRWGVAYIYGTCFALRGLHASGEDLLEAYVLRAGEWLRSIQNSDGGWGESCASYDTGAFVPAGSTPSQTAWAILGLLASGDTTSESVRKGVDYLLQTQRGDGLWDEELSTGTGFPRVFYLTYHLYRAYFPLMALAEYRKIKDVSHLDRL